MRGRTVFMDSLRAHGVRAIFGNPGTTESPLLDALADYPEVRYITCLHEGVAVSAANLYAQASGKTAVASVHVAPGLGNALGSLYGALKSGSPLILTAGQQDTRMRLRDPVLQHDLVAMAAPLTKWSVQVNSADEMAAVMQRAFKVANEAPSGPVFVALPINVMEQETANGAWQAGDLYPAAQADAAGIAAAVKVLAAAQHPVILAGDDVARRGAAQPLVQLAERLGAPVFHDTLRQHVVFPNRHPAYMGALPLEAGAIRSALGAADVVLMIGGPFFEEVWFDDVRAVPESAKVVQLAHTPGVLARDFNVAAGLVGALAPTMTALVNGLANALPANVAAERMQRLKDQSEQRQATARAALDKLRGARPMPPMRALEEIAKAMPANGIVVDESITAINDVGRAFELRAPGDLYGQRGGGIGQGIAGALGVKVAQPDRPVLAVSGDGSAMYAIQSLWTAAQSRLGIVFIILANREYRVLKHNMDAYRRRFDAASNRPYPHMELPILDFAALAGSMGVRGQLVDDPEQLTAAVQAAFTAAAKGESTLIEVVISGKQ